MITEGVITLVIKFLGLLVEPIFGSLYDNLGIASDSVRFMIPTPLWFVVDRAFQFSLVAGPFALAFWAWRQVKA